MLAQSPATERRRLTQSELDMLIDHHERSADVVAKTDVEAALIDQKRFLYLVSHHPFFAVEVMKVMAFRLRRFDASL